ncbi:MAG: YjfB family protein [Lachnospiraceae bacterium]|nr:YjfB family protein [Lachnospiraceae bacterium]
MDISGISMALSQIKTNTELGNKLLSKAMDTNEMMGEGIVKMIDKASMERSVNPAVGGNVDYSV